jgi:hypothetical protein
MRATVATKGIENGMSGMRIPYVSPTGAHGFDIPDPSAQFDINTYMVYFIAEYFRSNGTHLVDDACFAKAGYTLPDGSISACPFPGW